MSLTDPLHVLDTRRSVPSKQLGEPGPDHATLLRMLASAVRVPDHGKLVPFRFIRLQGEARHALGDLLAARTLHLQPDAADAVVEKDRARFSHAPVIVTVVAGLTPGHKVPEQEQLLTAGSVCFALLQAAQAAGFHGGGVALRAAGAYHVQGGLYDTASAQAGANALRVNHLADVPNGYYYCVRQPLPAAPVRTARKRR